MPKHKSLIISHRLVKAGKLRHCHHDRKHTMVKGMPCVEVREGLGWSGYCLECALAMVGDAEARLAELREQIHLARAR